MLMATKSSGNRSIRPESIASKIPSEDLLSLSLFFFCCYHCCACVCLILEELLAAELQSEDVAASASNAVKLHQSADGN